jgi:hypothetical protein
MKATTKTGEEGPVITKDKLTGMPLIQCKRAASSQEKLTPERVAEILLSQEVSWHHLLVDSEVGLGISKHYQSSETKS